MRAPATRCLGFAFLAGLLLPSSQLTGCMTEEDDRDSAIDVFPRPSGQKMIPLEGDFRALYRHTEVDTAGRIVEVFPELILDVVRQAPDTFRYAFQDPTRGYLIRHVESGDPDSSGIWIVGSFRDGRTFRDSTPVRWLPHNPETGKTWPLGAGRTMELVASDAEYLTDVILVGDTEAAPIVQGMQKHKAFRFKETAGDTLSYYFYRKGVGLLGYERSAGGRLIAAGSIRSFQRIQRP